MTPTDDMSKELDELLYEYAPEFTDVEHIKLRQTLQTLITNKVREAEGK